MAHDFSGWTTSSSKVVNAASLGMYETRAAFVTRCSVQWSCSATNATYGIPSNAPTAVVSIHSGDGGHLVASSPPRLVTVGTVTRVQLRSPMRTEYAPYSGNAIVLAFSFSSLPNGATISFCGTVWVKYAAHRIPYGIKGVLEPITDGDDDKPSSSNHPGHQGDETASSFCPC